MKAPRRKRESAKAERPRKEGRVRGANEATAVRPAQRVPLTLKVTREIRTLWCRDAYRAVRRAMQTVFDRDNFRIVHVSLERDHIHLSVEANHWRALSRGTQGGQVAPARRLNAAAKRGPGTVFHEHYFARAVTSPTQARHALSYVLNN